MDFSRHNLHRCFFAVDFPTDVNRTISALIAELRYHDNGAVRWTPPENLHLTLRFLGELKDHDFHRTKEFIATFPSLLSFSLQIQEIDAFPSRRKPSILILSIQGSTPDDQRRLLVLQKQTEEFAQQLKLEPETRPFHPHITLGRIKRERTLSTELRTALEETSPEDFGALTGKIDSLLLMESVLKPEGAEYRVAAKRALQ